MKKRFLIIILATLLACTESAIEPDNTPNLRALSSEEVHTVGGTNEFAFQLFAQLQKETPANTFISPLSVGYAIAMLINGAGEESQPGLLSTIGLADLSADEVNSAYQDITSLLLSMDRKVEIGVANSVWHDIDYPVNRQFANVITDHYDGKVEGLNFSDNSTKDKINGWVEDKTNQRIKDLLEYVDPAEVMFLINAIYFKGEWSNQFDKSKTYDGRFTTISGASEPAEMMVSTGGSILYHANEDLQFLDIPYGNGQFNFTVVMPHNPSEFSAIANSLSADKLVELSSQCDSLVVELELPKFKMEWKDDLKTVLGNMGMPMTGFPNLFDPPMGLGVSRVVHQSFLEVNEDGSEAAAATAIGIEFTSAPGVPLRIKIDRPFIFLIRERHSNLILFLGQKVAGD